MRGAPVLPSFKPFRMSSPVSDSRRTYFLNIAWSWTALVAMLATSGIVMPVLIRRLGTSQYGIWVLAVSLVEYFWLIDFGVRPATVKLSAEFRAVNRTADLDSLINTGLAYTSIAGGFVLLVLWLNAARVGSLLRIDDPTFAFVVRVVAISWATGLVCNVFAAVLEGFQRFDSTNRINILVTSLRGALSLVVVMAGYGLREMAITLLISQASGYLMTYLACRRVYPSMKLSPAHVSRAMAGKIFVFVRQMLSGIVGSRLSQAGLPAVIAYFGPVRFVTYFTQTQRLLEYGADVISRVAFVTAPRISDWSARGYRREIVALARSANRYCLACWGCLAAYLFVYGGQLCRVWINEEYGNEAAVLMPIFLVGYTLWMGQFISATVLMSTGRYTAFSLTLLGESLLVVAGVALVMPSLGLAGAAAVFSVCMIVSRAVVLSRLFAKEYELSQLDYVAAIYARPLALIIASTIALLLCREGLLAGSNWAELIAAGLLHLTIYVAAGFWLVIEPEHRKYLIERWSFWRQYGSLDPNQPVR
ncbi:MAG TPA: oligosaccharide flippase family protein [Vicinamibacterales bacterium]|nr:oligosaccharide flippase family protein [Vicinamibacterales bacterium]